MAKLLLNADGKVLTSNDKVLKAPDVEDRLKMFLDGRNAQYLFYNYTGTSIDDLIKYDDTENCTTFDGFCYNASKLTSMPLLNTSKGTRFNRFHQQMSSLNLIPNYDFSSGTEFDYLYYKCSKITGKVIVNSMNIEYLESSFRDCYLVNEVELLGINFYSSGKANYICQNCYSLTKLIIRNITGKYAIGSNCFDNCYHFTGTVNSTYNPDGLKDGRIYVPDDMVETLKSATNWSAYADIIVPLSTLQEE